MAYKKRANERGGIATSTPSTTPAAHSQRGASTMKRWKACPGSVALAATVPPAPSSSYADEGTKAHDVGAKLLEDPKHPLLDVDDDMLDAVLVYVQLINRETFAAGQKLERLIEHRFDLSSVHPGLFGTCDCVIFDAYEKRLKVYDYKHGAGIPVEVIEDGKPNSQLMYYALGALLSTGFACDEVELVIVQPRCQHPAGPVRRHVVPALEMLDFADELKRAALETEKENAPLVAGEHCRFCPAAAVCPLLAQKAQEIARQEFGIIEHGGGGTVGAGDRHGNDLGVADHGAEITKLSATLAWLPVLKSWIDNVHNHAYALALSGQEIPGWKLVEKRATRKWKDEAQVTALLQAEFPASKELFFTEPELKSVAQVEKVLHKKNLPLVEPFIVKESSGLTLVEAGDKRPEVKILDAKAEFELLDLMS